MTDTDLNRNSYRIKPQRVARCVNCGNDIIIPGYRLCLSCTAIGRNNGDRLPENVVPIGLKWRHE